MKGNHEWNVGLEFIDLECHSSINHAMLTLLGMRLSGGPHPLLSSTSNDQRVGNCPVLWLLNQFQETGIGSTWRHVGMQAFQTSSWSFVLWPKVFFRIWIWMFSLCVKASRDHTDYNMEVPVSQNSQSLVIHSKTCFASFIKLHGCQLHLQLNFPASHSSAVGPYSLYYARFNSLNCIYSTTLIVT